MFDIPFDLLPKAAIPAVMGTALCAYFVAGPEIATRVARVDYLPACQRDVAAYITTNAVKRRAEIQVAGPDPTQEAAAAGLRQLIGSNLFGEMRKHPLGSLMGLDQVTGALSVYEHRRVQAEQAAREMRQRLDDLTVRHLGRTGSVCGCLVDLAIAATRTDWAVFTASLSLVRSTRITEFGETMRRSDPDGACLKEVRP